MNKDKQKEGVIALRLVVLSFVIFISSSAHATELPIDSIKTLIQQQLKAFNANDYEVAYRYASRDIQSVLSRTEFEVMVRNGFPQIAQSRKSTFGRIVLSNDGTHADAIVHVTGVDHVTVIVRYELVREEGEWKNNGVIILEHITPV
ncbi:MAG: DUF4864 domain-containing protein [Nitrospira sp.]